MNPEDGKPRILAVTSGKGGVGKTNVAVNLALSLRMFGLKVLLLDADVSLGNVDVLLGLNVERDLRDVFLHGLALEDVVVDGPRGLKILPGACGVEELARLDEERMELFLAELDEFCRPMDFVVVDTAPGISPVVTNCLEAADEVILVTNAEPTALTDAYALLKVMCGRDGARRKAVLVLMNQTDSREEAVRSFDRLRAAARRFLHREVEYLGSVARDETVSAATKRQVDFLTHYAHSPCSRDVRKIAARLLGRGRSGALEMGRFLQRMAGVGDE